MKKLTTLSLAVLIGLSVTACNDKEDKKAPTQAEQVVVDPAAEFKTLTDWELAQDQKMQALNNELQGKVQQVMQTQNVAGLDQPVQEYLLKLDEIMKEFDSLKFQSAEIQALAAKKKELFSTSAEALTLTLKVVANPTQATKADEDKLTELANKLEQVRLDVETTQRALQEKYQPAPAAPAQ